MLVRSIGLLQGSSAHNFPRPSVIAYWSHLSALYRSVHGNGLWQLALRSSRAVNWQIIGYLCAVARPPFHMLPRVSSQSLIMACGLKPPSLAVSRSGTFFELPIPSTRNRELLSSSCQYDAKHSACCSSDRRNLSYQLWSMGASSFVRLKPLNPGTCSPFIKSLSLLLYNLLVLFKIDF